MSESLNEAIERHVAEIAKLIESIQLGVSNIEQMSIHGPKNWGYAGSLAKVESDLRDIANFINS